MHTVEVLIVGAGPVGLTLACELARRDVSFRIIDRALAPAIAVRGKGIQPRTQEVFDDLGVIEQIADRGQRNLPGRDYDREGRITDIWPEQSPANTASPDRPYAGVVIVGQQHTEAVLRDHLATMGVAVEWATELVGFNQHCEDVTAAVHRRSDLGPGPQRISARYLVGCDGGHSTVRKHTRASFLGETWDQEHFLLADLDVDGLETDRYHSWIDAEGGFFILVPLRNDRNWALEASVAPEPGAMLPDPTLDLCQQIVTERTGRTDITVSKPTSMTLWRPNIRMVDKFRDRRVFLAGDAAHVHSGAGGQGMNTGIQDAYNLGWKLAHVLRGAPESLLDSFHDERWPIARVLLSASTQRHRSWLHTSSGGAAETARTAMVSFALGDDPFNDTSQLGINYRSSPLAQDFAALPSVRAGDRAPDAPVNPLAHTGPSRLFDLFRGIHLTQLVFAGMSLGDRAVENHPPASTRFPVRTVTIARTASQPSATMNSGQLNVVDTDGHAHRAYGVTDNAIVLVRPDGYIGLTAPHNIPTSTVQKYLAALTGE
jgi:2-polyprenyl-6-methoxyphenol hydroxylase-like FAD-dependent oxidoreductase